MTQATGGMSPSNMYVGLSAAGSVWTDVSGYGTSVEVSGGERATGSVYTFEGDTPLQKVGKRGLITVTIRGVYTEAAAQFYTLAKTAYEGGSTLYARWSPGGGDAGDLGFTTNAGVVKNCIYPSGAADSADPILTEIVLEVATVTQAAIGTAGW